jgi:hypothetical protein
MLQRMMCPSAQPEMSDAVILGVRSGDAETPYVSYLDEPAPVSDELLALANPLKPTEVFRFAGRCEERACRHFDGSRCRLATRIVQILPAAVESLPSCKIRHECRWFRQEGRAACVRCPQVITEVEQPSAEFRRAATPE